MQYLPAKRNCGLRNDEVKSNFSDRELIQGVKKLSARNHILTALKGNRPERFPLTIYTARETRGAVKLIYDGIWERKLRNRGLALIYRAPAFITYNDNLEIIEKKHKKDGNIYVKTIWRSSHGEISKVARIEAGYNTYFTQKKFLKEDEDYTILNKILQEQQFIPNYERINILERNLGDDGLVMIRADKTVYNRLIYQLIDIEKFIEDLYEKKPELLALMDTLEKIDRKSMKIIANAPAQIVQISDNITGPMIGGQRYNKFCAPFYSWTRKLLQKNNKLFCVHMDGHLKSIAEEIGDSDVPIIEGFTPPPDGDLSLKDAKRLWPQKSIWLNFPSSVHIESSEVIKKCTENILKEAPETGFLFGITENIPEKHWFRSLSAILDVLETV